MRSRTTARMSTYVGVVISPATTTRPVVTSVSHATRPPGSSARTASRTESEIWSAILSGWPSVTDSDVKRKCRTATLLLDLQEPIEAVDVAVRLAPEKERAKRLQAFEHVRRNLLPLARAVDVEEVVDPVRQVDVREAGRLVGRPRGLARARVVVVVLQRVAVALSGRDPGLRRRDDELAVEGRVVDVHVAARLDASRLD